MDVVFVNHYKFRGMNLCLTVLTIFDLFVRKQEMN
ncbi:hypothetical protein PALU110988_04965 [Paenibacillus lupini]|nr:hypothetical protein [Paenibacillus lupini]